MCWLFIHEDHMKLGFFLKWRRRDRADCVTEQWLKDQRQRDDSAGIDAVNWRWPVRKITDEAGRFNAARLRKRA